MREGISRTQTVAALLVVVILAVAAVLALVYLKPSTSTSSTSPTSTSSSSTMTTTSSSTPNSTVQTLSIDSWTWPINDLNQLYSLSELPWPNWLMYSVYQPLVSVNETAELQSGYTQYLPGLAANWTTSSDQKTFVFNLRQNVHFSNGDPFNAYQAWAELYGFIYLSANSSTWLESYPLFDLSNVRFGPSTIALMTQSGVTSPNAQMMSIMKNSSWPIYVTGPYQIVFHLKVPFQWFPGTLVVYDGLMFDVQWVLQNGGFGNPTTFNGYFNQHPIPGSGPYVVTGVAENGYVKFAQDPNYWGNSLSAAEIAAQPIWDPGHAKNVVVYYKPDNIARFADLSNNIVQIAAIQPSMWYSVTSNPDLNYLKMPAWNGDMTGLVFNMKVYPTNITDVRLAIDHAINMTDLIQKAYGGQLTPFVGPEYPFWKDFYDLGGFQPYQYNLTLAKQYLTDSKITNMPTLTLKTVSGCDVCSLSAQVLQADLAQIGINLNILVQPTVQVDAGMGPYTSEINNPGALPQLEFINSGFGWGPATLTPADYWVSFVSNGSVWGNFAVYYNPIVQKCVDSFTSTATVAEIQNLCKAAQQQLYNDSPYDWVGTWKLWLPPGGSLVWKSGVVKGFLVDPVWTGQDTEPILNTVTFG